MSRAKSGHDAVLAITKLTGSYPTLTVADADTFTDIAQIRQDVIGFDGNAPEEESTPHGADVDHWVVSDVVMRNAHTVQGNFIAGSATHDKNTGLEAAFRAKPRPKIGVLYKGPDWVNKTTDEVRGSAYVTAFKITAPEKPGIVNFQATLRFDGPYDREGEATGTADVG